ncbi:MAG: AbrB family transcriptional regulator [Leptolyngbyaceae cyanobacterium bins.59]|nr:AbrB family transcriptional regulator [Leptolyngbyaceae cyanobacterium bins.59]
MTETTIFRSRWDGSVIAQNGLVVGELLLAVICGLGFVALGTGGGAWILGGIAAGTIGFSLYRAWFKVAIDPNRTARKLGQILIGLTVGFSIQHDSLSALSFQVPLLIGVAFFLLFNGSLIGYLYSRLEKTDLLTATLATIPGNVGVMASIAADYGRNTALVSLVQLLRFTSIIIVVPLVANVANPRDVGATIHSLITNLQSFSTTSLLMLSGVVGLAVLAALGGNRLKMPVANFICPIAVGILVSQVATFPAFSELAGLSIPLLLKVIGQILLGITIGEYWAMNPHLKQVTAFRAMIPVALTFLGGFTAAQLLHLVTQWDWLTCLLVAAPGGSPEMIWIALALNHNIEIVTASHVIRLLTINLSIPLLISLVTLLEQRISVSMKERSGKSISDIPG